jgi:hypothetical protein
MVGMKESEYKEAKRQLDLEHVYKGEKLTRTLKPFKHQTIDSVYQHRVVRKINI